MHTMESLRNYALAGEQYGNMTRKHNDNRQEFRALSYRRGMDRIISRAVGRER